MQDEFLTTREAAAFTRFSYHTLTKYRVIGGGPPFIKLTKKVVYSKADLLAFMAGGRTTSTSSYGGAATSAA